MKQPEGCKSIEAVRQAIDTLDREVIAPVGHRARYVDAATRFKTGEQSVRAPNANAR